MEWLSPKRGMGKKCRGVHLPVLLQPSYRFYRSYLFAMGLMKVSAVADE
jgi:hypothetical protein